MGRVLLWETSPLRRASLPRPRRQPVKQFLTPVPSAAPDHADLQTTARYLHSHTRAKQAAVGKLAAAFGGPAASQRGGGPG
jgi:hypothetical protein